MLNLFSISDGTGETAQALIKAVTVQFEDMDVEIARFHRIRSRLQIEAVLTKAVKKNALLVVTIVEPELRIFFISRVMQLGLHFVDLLFPLLQSISEKLGRNPNAIPGKLRQIDENYYQKLTAVEFNVRHDDGMALNNLGEADIILVGVSRTSKTPLAMYLGYKGYKVANVPIVPTLPLPKQIYQVDQKKIVGLIIEPSRLAEIRHARVQSWVDKHPKPISYLELSEIEQEIRFSRELFRKNEDWKVLDVTGKALEEIAVEIEDIYNSTVHRLP